MLSCHRAQKITRYRSLLTTIDLLVTITTDNYRFTGYMLMIIISTSMFVKKNSPLYLSLLRLFVQGIHCSNKQHMHIPCVLFYLFAQDTISLKDIADVHVR